MSDSWDFYFCRVDDKAASIFLDLGLSTPQSDRPEMTYLRLFMRNPREDGLSSQEEYTTLKEIETTLEKAANKSNAVYVGRNTTDGFRDHVFYSANGMVCEKSLVSALAQFEDYQFETGSRPDPDWSTYREFLYPNPRQRQIIENRRLYHTLQKNGDGLTKPREIDHWVYFSDTRSRSAFIESCGDHGFEVRQLRDPDPTLDRFCAQIFRTDTPNPEKFDDVVILLFDLAASTGGEYDGWETQVV